jgi:hypothetical protein
MTMTKTLDGTKIDGTPKYAYTYTGDPDGGLLITGPVSGTVRLADGTAYNVTPEVIEHGPGHAGPICHHIEVMHQESGFLGADFVHTCTEACGAEPTPAAPTTT